AAHHSEWIDLVEEQHARRVAARCLEDGVEVLLALAQPHVEDVVESNRVEVSTDFPRDRSGKKRLAASGRPVHEEPPAKRLAVETPQLGIAHRSEKRHLESPFDMFEPANISQRD